MTGAAGVDPGSRPGPGVYQAVLERVREWSATTRALFLRLPAGQCLAFKPGQFISLEFPGPDAESLVRAYSLCSAPEDGNLLEVCVDRVSGGQVSPRLFALEPGAPVAFKGPFGSFVLDQPMAGEMVFIAEATAIAPIRAMVRRAVERGAGDRVRVLHGARRATDLVYRQDFVAWMRAAPGLLWEPVLAGTSADVGDRLAAVVTARYVPVEVGRSRHIWICGVGDVVVRLRSILRAAGYDRRTVRCERW